MQVDFTLISTKQEKEGKKKQDVFVGMSSYYSKNRMIIVSFTSSNFTTQLTSRLFSYSFD